MESLVVIDIVLNLLILGLGNAIYTHGCGNYTQLNKTESGDGSGDRLRTSDFTTEPPITSNASDNSTTKPTISTECRLIDWVVDFRKIQHVLSSGTIIAPKKVNIGYCFGHCCSYDYRKRKRRQIELNTAGPFSSCSPVSSCNVCPCCQADSLTSKAILEKLPSGHVRIRTVKNVVVTRCSCHVWSTFCLVMHTDNGLFLRKKLGNWRCVSVYVCMEVSQWISV